MKKTTADHLPSGILDREAFAEHLDASWQTFRQQLLDAYPSMQATSGLEVKPELQAELQISSIPDPAAGVAQDVQVTCSDVIPKDADAPSELGELPAKIAGRASWSSVDSNGLRHRNASHILSSGFIGLSDVELTNTKNRLRLRLGILSPKMLVSGKTLLDAVSSLGLTRYTEEDMNDFVNQLGDFIGLQFASLPEKMKRASQSALFSFEPMGQPDMNKLGTPKWQWPLPEKSRDLPNLRSSLSTKGGPLADKVAGQRSVAYNVVPAQPLLDIFLAQESDVHRRIFGARGINQYRAMKEILLAGDTNRLVAELTFVRINDLAAPPEPMHPIMYLEPLVAILIVGNGIMIGFQTDPHYKDWHGWVYIEIAFAACLILEVGLRMCMLGFCGYWCGSERLWNWFDMFLMCTGLSDIAIQLLDDQQSGVAGTSLLRFCRLIRLVRIVKVFRIKFMKDLRLMVKGLIAGIRTLALAFVLLFAVLYVISGFTTMTIGSSPITEEIGLSEYFSNIPNSMFTTFRCFTGECVNDEGQPIHSLLASKFGLLFILAYVSSYMLVTMGIFNVILAVYVDITMKAAKENDAVTAEQYSRESIRVARCTRELLKNFSSAYHSFHDHRQSSNSNDDHDMEQTPVTRVNTCAAKALYTEDGMHDKIAITKELFLLIIQDRGVQKLMDELDLPHDRANLFEIIDADGSGTLQITELLQGLLKIRGEINKSDTVASYLATKAVFSMVTEMKEEQAKQLQSIRSEFARCFASLPATKPTPAANCLPLIEAPESPVLDLDQVRLPAKPEAFIEAIETEPPFA